ncbi:MAG: class I tRNA ligase family protein, partial [bacterium]
YVSAPSSKVIASSVLFREKDRLIKKVTEDIEAMKFNTAISTMMAFINKRVNRNRGIGGWESEFVRLLAPFAPHLAEELWQGVMKKDGSVCDAKAGWPTFDEAKVALQTVAIVVQEKGKLRGTVILPAGANEKEVLVVVNKDPRLAKIATDASKHIFVPDRVINFI